MGKCNWCAGARYYWPHHSSQTRELLTVVLGYKLMANMDHTFVHLNFSRAQSGTRSHPLGKPALILPNKPGIGTAPHGQLSSYCCITNHHKTEWQKPASSYVLRFWEFSGFSGQHFLGICHVVAVIEQLGLGPSQGLTGWLSRMMHLLGWKLPLSSS